MKKNYNSPLVEVMSMTSVSSICVLSPGGGNPYDGFDVIKEQQGGIQGE